MLYVPPDHRLIQFTSRREKAGRPPPRSPLCPLQPGIPEPKWPTYTPFHLAHKTRTHIVRRKHQSDRYVINLHMPLLDLHIGVIVLDLRYLLWHNHLDRPLQKPSTVLGESHLMVLVRTGPMSPETDVHARVSSQPPHGARSPPAASGERLHPRAHAPWSSALALIDSD